MRVYDSLPISLGLTRYKVLPLPFPNGSLYLRRSSFCHFTVFLPLFFFTYRSIFAPPSNFFISLVLWYMIYAHAQMHARTPTQPQSRKSFL